MSYLLDTNVVSELIRRRPEPRVETWLETQAAIELNLSVLVLGELRRGVERLRGRDPLQARRLEQWLTAVSGQFGGRILTVSADVADAWGRLSARTTLPVVDALLAATAAVHGLTVVTRDTGPFEIAGVPVVNPWEA